MSLETGTNSTFNHHWFVKWLVQLCPILNRLHPESKLRWRRVGEILGIISAALYYRDWQTFREEGLIVNTLGFVKTILSPRATHKQALVCWDRFTIYKSLSLPLFHLIHLLEGWMLKFPFIVEDIEGQSRKHGAGPWRGAPVEGRRAQKGRRGALWGQTFRVAGRGFNASLFIVAWRRGAGDKWGGKFFFFLIFYLLIVERETHRFVVALSYAFIGCFLTGDQTLNLGTPGRHSNQMSYLARPSQFFMLIMCLVLGHPWGGGRSSASNFVKSSMKPRCSTCWQSQNVLLSFLPAPSGCDPGKPQCLWLWFSWHAPV